jgi:hypothetical protein
VVWAVRGRMRRRERQVGTPVGPFDHLDEHRGGAPTVYSLNLAHDTWFENELSRYLVAVKPCVSLGDCPAAG